MAFLVATTSLPAVYRPNGYARTATPERRPLERRTLVLIINDVSKTYMEEVSSNSGGTFKEVSKLLWKQQVCVEVSWKWQGRFLEVSRKYSGDFKQVLRKSHVTVEKVSR